VPEPPVASQGTSPTRITSGRAESGGYRAASEAQLVQGAATFRPLRVPTQAVGPAVDPGVGSTVPGAGGGPPDREPNALEGQLPPEPAPTASVGQPAGDPPGDGDPPDDDGDDDPSGGKDDTEDSACPCQWCGQSFRSEYLAGHTATCPERPEDARGSAASHLKTKVRAAPLGLLGLARGSAASHLIKTKSAHCAPGAAWSGQKLGCEPPQKKRVRTASLGLRGMARGSAASHLTNRESAHCAPGAACSGQKLRCEPLQKKRLRTAPLGLRGLARGSAASHLKKKRMFTAPGCVVWPEAPLRVTSNQ